MTMPHQCARCLRNMYTIDTWDEAIEPYREINGPWTVFYNYHVFTQKWAWQSEWIPHMCRECDTDHDHRKSPPFWHRLRLWWNPYYGLRKDDGLAASQPASSTASPTTARATQLYQPDSHSAGSGAQVTWHEDGDA